MVIDSYRLICMLGPLLLSQTERERERELLKSDVVENDYIKILNFIFSVLSW
jgi:hypothetical protein